MDAVAAYRVSLAQFLSVLTPSRCGFALDDLAEDADRLRFEIDVRKHLDPTSHGAILCGESVTGRVTVETAVRSVSRSWHCLSRWQSL